MNQYADYFEVVVGKEGPNYIKEVYIIKAIKFTTGAEHLYFIRRLIDVEDDIYEEAVKQYNGCCVFLSGGSVHFYTMEDAVKFINEFVGPTLVSARLRRAK